MPDPGDIWGYPPCCVNWFDSMIRGAGIPLDWPSLEGPMRTDAEREMVRREMREWSAQVDARLRAALAAESWCARQDEAVVAELEAGLAELETDDDDDSWDQDERPHWRPCPYHRANPPPDCTLVPFGVPPAAWEGC